MKKNKQLNTIETAIEIFKNKKSAINIHNLMKEICIVHNIELNNYEKISQLYLDITLSGEFIFYGNKNMWILKKNNVELWNKDYYSTKEKKNKFNTMSKEKENIDTKNNINNDIKINNNQEEEIFIEDNSNKNDPFNLFLEANVENDVEELIEEEFDKNK